MTITYQYRHLGKPNPVHRATEPATAPIGQEAPESAAPSTLESLIREYARDLRRNSSGGDDYPWEWAKATANYLEVLIGRSVAEQSRLWHRIRKVEHDNNQAAARIDELESALKEAGLQIEYLHGKFQPTGTGEAMLARINQTLGEGR